MGLIDGFELKEGTGWQAAIQAAPAVLAGVQAIQAQINYGKRMTDIENARRQDLENPFANMSNPYENLAVATKAAEIQMEQTDQALANTLDTLRETGAAAGGATAIANAALKSKQGVAASIEKQEVDNQRLQAQGQQQIDIAKGNSQLRIMQTQENREIAGLDRLQGQADIAMATRNQSINTGIAALGTGGQTLADGLLLNQIPDPNKNILIDPGVEKVNLSASNLANNALADIQSNYDPLSQLTRTQDVDNDGIDDESGMIIPRRGGNIKI